MSKKEDKDKQDSDKVYYGRNLESYKSQHRQTARDKGCYDEFMAAPTLTRARRILFGVKTKHFKCCKDVCSQCKSGKR